MTNKPWSESEIMQPGWEVYTQWQADCLKYAIEEKGMEVIFSHIHNVDNMAIINVHTVANPHFNAGPIFRHVKDTYRTTYP